MSLTKVPNGVVPVSKNKFTKTTVLGHPIPAGIPCAVEVVVETTKLSVLCCMILGGQGALSPGRNECRLSVIGAGGLGTGRGLPAVLATLSAHRFLVAVFPAEGCGARQDTLSSTARVHSPLSSRLRAPLSRSCSPFPPTPSPPADRLRGTRTATPPHAEPGTPDQPPENRTDFSSAFLLGAGARPTLMDSAGRSRPGLSVPRLFFLCPGSCSSARRHILLSAS